MIAIHHCLAQKSEAVLKSEIPIRVMVGVMVRGPMNLSTDPNRPVLPITTCAMADTAIDPWICNMGG